MLAGQAAQTSPASRMSSSPPSPTTHPSHLSQPFEAPCRKCGYCALRFSHFLEANWLAAFCLEQMAAVEGNYTGCCEVITSSATRFAGRTWEEKTLAWVGGKVVWPDIFVTLRVVTLQKLYDGNAGTGEILWHKELSGVLYSSQVCCSDERGPWMKHTIDRCEEASKA